jgi:DNA-binding CsgD family transcriptional regulator
MTMREQQFIDLITPYLNVLNENDLRRLTELTLTNGLCHVRVMQLLKEDPAVWDALLTMPMKWLWELDFKTVSLTVPLKLQAYRLNQAYGLTPRQLETLYWMALGLTYPELAEKMIVSLTTIKTHASNLFSKLSVNEKTQAVCLAHAYDYPPSNLLKHFLTQKTAA